MLNNEQYDLIKNDIEKNIDIFLENKYNKQYEAIKKYFIKTLSTDKPILKLNSINLNGYENLKFDETIICYAQNILFHIYEISNHLAEITDEYNIQIVTMIPYKIFNLFVDFKKILICNNLSNNFPIYEMLIDNKDSNNNIKLNQTPLLLKIYNKLINPYYYKDWNVLLQCEYNIFKNLKYYNINFNIKLHKKIEQISGLILGNLIINNNKTIIVGENATNIMLKSDNKLTYVLEIISENDFKEIFESVKKILNNNNLNIKLYFKIESLNIIDNHKIKRLTLYTFFDDRKHDLLYCYNNTQYMLIPIHKIEKEDNFVLIGSPLVLLYFMLINIWIIHWKMIEKNIKTKILDLKVKYIFNIYMKYRESLMDINLFSATIEDYKGQYVDELVELKLSKMKMSQFSRYNPILYKTKNGEYKKIKLISN